jgi:RHS repeat-associated protein
LNGAGTWQHSNAFEGGRLTATYDQNGLHFAIADPLGTKRVQAVITALNGAAQWDEYCYSLPFGNNIGNTRQTNCQGPGVDATEHHFTGKERDSESGNDYFEARYYASSMGRFMSPDWSAKEEPVPYAQLDDPQSLNLYAYVRNNPLTRTDLTGHCPQCALVLGTTEGGALIGSPGGPPGAAVGAVVGAVVGTVAAVAATYFGMKALSNWLHKDAPAPTGPVGTDPQPTKGSRTKSGPLAPEHGGSGDAGKDFGTLTGGKSAPAAPEKRYPAGTQVGENGVALRPASGTAGPKIDIPANGSNPHETLHYPPPPPPPPTQTK